MVRYTLRERKFQGMKVPRSKSSIELSFPGAKRPGSGRAWERKFQGTNWPRSEKARERKGQGAKVPGSESSRESIGQDPIGLFAPGSELAREQKGSVPSYQQNALYNPPSPYGGRKNHYVFLIPYTLHYNLRHCKSICHLSIPTCMLLKTLVASRQ